MHFSFSRLLYNVSWALVEVTRKSCIRLQFGQFGRSYRVMFHFLTNFVPRVLGCVSSYPVRLNQQITSIYPFSR
ncbi:hypothetical protein KSS87_016101 [Heliosperma pusillum]|nr:hypothetical protein KSS87_016101 [Heliosperma pusillum]